MLTRRVTDRTRRHSWATWLVVFLSCSAEGMRLQPNWIVGPSVITLVKFSLLFGFLYWKSNFRRTFHSLGVSVPNFSDGYCGQQCYKTNQEHPFCIFAMDAMGQSVIHFTNYFLRKSTTPVCKFLGGGSFLSCLDVWNFIKLYWSVWMSRNLCLNTLLNLYQVKSANWSSEHPL